MGGVTDMARTKTKRIKPARLIGPEDVRPGLYVTVAETTWQVLYVPEESGIGAPEARIARVSGWDGDAGWPLRVVSVSLPYVLAIDRDGDHVAVDLRRSRLARLSKAYGQAAFAALKKREESSAAPAGPAAVGATTA